MNKKILSSGLSLLLASTLLAACSPATSETTGTPGHTADSGSASASESGSAEMTGSESGTDGSESEAVSANESVRAGESNPETKWTLAIGVMPAVDSAPIFLADEKGYFAELGLDVEAQVYTNAMNRQSALQSGGLDGAITDVIALVNNVENGFAIKVTTSVDGVFPFLIHEDITGKKQLKAGMMEVSVTNYLSDRMLADYELEKIYINEIPARLQMVGEGTLDLAVIPEPMASQGALKGLEKLYIENPDEFSPDVMVFTDAAIAEKPEAIQAFHDAYNKAVEEILADDSEARELLVSKLELDPAVTDDIIMPAYNLARVPDEAYFRQIQAWNADVLGEESDVSYEELVDPQFTGQ